MSGQHDEISPEAQEISRRVICGMFALIIGFVAAIFGRDLYVQRRLSIEYATTEGVVDRPSPEGHGKYLYHFTIDGEIYKGSSALAEPFSSKEGKHPVRYSPKDPNLSTMSSVRGITDGDWYQIAILSAASFAFLIYAATGFPEKQIKRIYANK